MIELGVDRTAADPATIAALGRGADAAWSAVAGEPSVDGVVLLVTCARVEAYVDGTRFHEVSRALVAGLSRGSGLPAARIEALLHHRRGPEALEHLFRVSTGLESAVVGESQVVGQVRAAHREARARGTASRGLDLAFENAVRVSRQARATLGSTGSITAAALDQAGVARPGTVLVVGTGALARDVVAEVRALGAHTVWVHSPSGRASSDLTGMGADALVAPEELPLALALSDVTVTVSGHGRPAVTSALVDAARRLRCAPLTVVDLSGTGDVAELADPDVSVVRLADVSREAHGAGMAAAVVAREARALAPRIVDRELDDVISTLRSTILGAVEDEAARIGDDAAAAALRRAARTLLHGPTERARASAATGELARFREAVRLVFGAEPASPAEAADGSAA